MAWVKLIWDEMVGMFVDDGALALQAAVLIGVVAVGVKTLGVPPLLGGIVLLAGCILALALSIVRKTRGR
jgi:hypothetical protein